jgi:hypothetical protein
MVLIALEWGLFTTEGTGTRRKEETKKLRSAEAVAIATGFPTSPLTLLACEILFHQAHASAQRPALRLLPRGVVPLGMFHLRRSLFIKSSDPKGASLVTESSLDLDDVPLGPRGGLE